MFRLLHDAERWFRYIRPSFDYDFDVYYFCLIAGLTDGYLRSDIPSSQTKDLVDNFPGKYREKGRLIIGFFLSRHLKKMGVSFDERDALNATINPLINPDSPSRLSDEGIRYFNHYSYGGFEVLTNHFLEEPRNAEVFLPEYHRMISSLAKG